MRLNADHLDHARRVADAILYEGYLLYPYHKAAQKNQVRFQFGVLMPRGYDTIDPNEAGGSQTECLLECPDDAEVRVLVRFLHLQRRLVQGVSPETGDLHDVGTLYVDGTEYTAWDEAAEREQRVAAVVSDLLAGESTAEFHIGSGEAIEELADSRGRSGWAAGPPVECAGRCHPACGRAGGRALPGPEADGRGGEQHDRADRAPQPRRRPAARADRRAFADRRAGRDLPVDDRPAGVGRRRGRRLPEHRDLAGPGRSR